MFEQKHQRIAPVHVFVRRVVGYIGMVFASFYALFSGLVFIAVMGIVFSPIAHRMLHTL